MTLFTGGLDAKLPVEIFMQFPEFIGFCDCQLSFHSTYLCFQLYGRYVLLKVLSLLIYSYSLILHLLHLLRIDRAAIVLEYQSISVYVHTYPPN